MTRQFFINPYIIPFFVSFSLVAFFMFPLTDLLVDGTDANSVWQTIISFGNDAITSSYVLYKGFLSVYPYVWFYRGALALGLDPFLFIKLYHCFLFASVSAIGVPYVIANILSVKLRMYRNAILVCIIFYMFKFTYIFNWLMIDLPSWTFFVAGICCVLKLAKQNVNSPKFYFFCSGMIVGLSLCASGQYSLAGYLLIIYLVSAILRQNNLQQIIQKKKIMLVIFIFIFGVSIAPAYDSYFEKTIVQPMRARGDWLPTGKEWFMNGMTRALPIYKFSYPDVSNRGLAILKKTAGDKFSQRYELIKHGGGSYSIREYLRILHDNAFDFIIMWGTKAFIAISFDGGHAKVSHLLISYISLFLCLNLLFRRCKKVKDLMSSKSIIILAIISTIAAPVFFLIDMRYVITLQGFILGFALLDDYIWHDGRKFLYNIKNIVKAKELKVCMNCTIPYSWVLFAMYLLFCFLLYGALLEVSGSDPSRVLFRF